MKQPDSRFLLHMRFQEQARMTPDRVALHFKSESITFADLKIRSDRLAEFLRSREIGKGSVVGLHMERSINFVASLLGILASNSAVMPLPPSYPENRLRELILFARLDAIIIDGNIQIQPVLGNNIINFHDTQAYSGEMKQGPSGNSNQNAIILCSSGSTGTPKMIVRSHRSFFHRLNWTWQNHPYAFGESCCQKSHMTTTHSIYELFEPLLSGIPIHIIPDEITRDIELFWEIIREKAISRLLIVPSALRAALDMPGFCAPHIKVLVLMGEYINHNLAERVIQLFPKESGIFSIYGSTEASSTLVCDLKVNLRANEELPLGKPISTDVQAYVLDENLKQVANGEIGLLHIAGPALFSEYFRNSALTDSVLSKASENSCSLYNTQDQVRLMLDGSFQFIGRVDHTVKIRGFRVDLQEVERTLALYPEVNQSTVLTRGDASQSQILMAFVTPESVNKAALYKFLKGQLPEYMIPSVTVAVNIFPLTSSGKTNRQKLLEDYEKRETANRDYSTQSKAETITCGVWKGLLNQGDIPLDGSFFEMGGTSLTVFQAVHRLRNAFGLDRSQLSDQSIYRFPTVRKLASYIESVVNGGGPINAAGDSILVTMKEGNDADAPPFFVIASAGGTLGAYTKLAKALRTERDIIGVRDPFIWGERDPTLGFQKWVAIYVRAIQEKQAKGPYYLGAYSSAGSFCYEIAQHLQQNGQEVALMVLVDPLAIDSKDKWSVGYWALQAMFRGDLYRRFVLTMSWLYGFFSILMRNRVLAVGVNDRALTKEEWLKQAARCRRSKDQIIVFSALLELNSNLPFSLTESDFIARDPNDYFSILMARVREVSSEIDLDAIERIFLQYFCLQIPAQHEYKIGRYSGKVVIFEPEGFQRGLLRAVFRSRVREFRVRYLKLGVPTEREQKILKNLSGRIQPHYLSMRDDVFVEKLSKELEILLSI